jgi:hypothetical protein
MTRKREALDQVIQEMMQKFQKITKSKCNMKE